MKYLFLIILFSTLLSCNTVEKHTIITDFENVYKDTLKPNQNGSYAVAKYKIIGEVNDTIKVSFFGREKKYFGKFEYDFFLDYYGMVDVEFIFDPYKAAYGNLK